MPSFKLEYEFKYDESTSGIPFLVDDIVLNAQGLLQIFFNKPLAIPMIYQEFKSKTRELQVTKDYLDQWIDIQVTSDYYESGALEIKITNYTLISFESKVIEIMLQFEMPARLSKNIISPEYLLVDFKQPLYGQDGTELAVE